ncbi:MAG: type II toxin-antitoxin system Phd/YefM family antitoxin [Limisphaerales bacterium]
MKTISLSELRARTAFWVRESAQYGEIHVTARGKPVAKIVPCPPEVPESDVPYFARRKMSPEFRKLQEGKLKGGTDSTQAISEDREDRC